MASTATTVVNVGGVDYELRFLDLLPRVDDETFAAMEADILANGIKYDVQAKKLVEEMGHTTVLVVDGNHRVLIAKKHGLHIPVKYRKEFLTMTDEELEERAWSLNRKRRQLSSDQIVELAARLGAKGLSRRAAAKKIGVPESTLRAAQSRCSGAQSCAPEHPKPSIDERREKVKAARDEDKSVREIADEIGVSVGTVHSDLKSLADGIHSEDGEQLEIPLPLEEAVSVQEAMGEAIESEREMPPKHKGVTDSVSAPG